MTTIPLVGACATCPQPGHCCRGFTLNHVFSEDDTLETADKWLVEQGLPFKAAKWWPGKAGDQQLDVTCPVLTPEGRCGDYENRPALCRDFPPQGPGGNNLCVLAHDEGETCHLCRP